MTDIAKEKSRKNLPEGFWRFLIISFIIYSFFIVGKVIYDNYYQNKGLDQKKDEIDNLKLEISDLRYNIAYYKTNTYKEKIARSKLRYSLPGETVVAVPYDEIKENMTQDKESPKTIARPNYVFWAIYFFGRK